MIEIVSATRMKQDDFWRESALGQSLLRLASDDRIAAAHIAYENRRGLPEVYNERLAADGGNDVLVFVHDDVWLDDFFFADRVLEGLRDYDIIGVAGNRRRLPGQCAWPFADTRFTWDARENLSGAVAHGKGPFGQVSRFGPAPADCELLDGVLLAARKSALRGAGAQFDPRFDFHFYDLDLCRTARAAGLRLGTWPICMTHQSDGAFGTPGWQAGYAAYLRKWEA